MKKINLSPLEKELMSILWRIGEGTVHDVKDNYPRPLAYNSVSTILRILEKKKIVKTKKQGRQHIYVPILTQAKFAKSTLGELVQLTNEPVGLISYLLSVSKLDKKDIEEVEELITTKLKED